MNRPRITTFELLLELGRELFATALILALIIPALVIYFVSTLSSILFRRIGGID
ncbi:MAG: hypothetical protein Kow0074_20300 [Candidatus Zixiibacteriota bacterium]